MNLPRAVLPNDVPPLKNRHDLWLCVDCLLVAVNGDDSGLDNLQPEEAAKRRAEIYAGLERLGYLAPNFDSETGEGVREFMRPVGGCGCCGSPLAGTFHRFEVSP